MRIFYAAIAAALMLPASAFDPCADIPPEAAAYLAANPGWAVIRPTDLSASGRKIWGYRHSCPGLALADLDGSGRPFAALGLIRGHSEKVVLVRQGPYGLEIRVLIPEEPADEPLVLFRLPPGQARAWESGEPVTISHDSVGIAWNAASSRQYYWDGAAFRSAESAE